MCGVTNTDFVIGDVRRLGSLVGLSDSYDVVICLECIEHILDDLKLVRDMAAKIKPGGRLLLTTPNYFYVPISPGDRGPFRAEETGWHVRRGYTAAMLTELCQLSGLTCSEITYCSGFVSQKVTAVWRQAGRLPGGAAVRWALTLPLRLVAAGFPDHVFGKAIGWPFFSICLEAYKPRFGEPRLWKDSDSGTRLFGEVRRGWESRLERIDGRED
jgi:SAM-dependent methyltransferase